MAILYSVLAWAFATDQNIQQLNEINVSSLQILSSSNFVVVVVVVLVGPHLAMTRAYSWLWAQGSVPVGSEDYVGYWGLNLSRQSVRQAPLPVVLSLQPQAIANLKVSILQDIKLQVFEI